MHYLIGVDEAGYGPNLGPLVIAATLWELDDKLAASSGDDGRLNDVDLYEVLDECVANGTKPGKLGALTTSKNRPLWIADSKQVYRSGQGLADLERSALASLGALPANTAWRHADGSFRAGNWRDVWESLSPGALEYGDLPDWYQSFELSLPTAADNEDIGDASEFFSAGCKAAGVRLRAVAARAIFAGEFNELVADCGSKGVVLSEASVDLVVQLLDSISVEDEAGVRTHGRNDLGMHSGDQQLRPDASAIRGTAGAAELETPSPLRATIICDKHGGRKQYAGLVQHCFRGGLPLIERETAAVSCYRCDDARRSVRVRFEARGERHLPVALASIFAKYLRETAMIAFNAYWRNHFPGLKPTAGYPVDAKRFLGEIGEVCRQNGILREKIWRNR